MNFMQGNLVRAIPICLACAALAHAGPVTIGGLWYEFYFTGVGSQVQMCSVTNAGCVPSPSSNSSFAPDPPWTFTAPANGAILTVTDVQKPGTSFDIFDFGKLIGSTPLVSGSQEDCGIDPVPCLADQRWSHGAFTLGSGAHSITMSTNASFFGQGLGYFRLDAANAQTPAIASINAQFGNAAHLAPGAPMYIIGSNLGITLSDLTTILIGGRSAPIISFIGITSLLAQVPVDMPIGSTTVTATYKGSSSAPFTVVVDAFAPAIYNPSPSAFTDSSGTAITAARPAVPNTTVSLTAIALGPTKPPMATGVKAAAAAPTTTPVQVLVGGKMAVPDYAGLLVGSATDYQVTFKIPLDVPAGSQPVTISVAGVTSGAVTLPVGLPVPVVNAIVNGATFQARGAAPNSFVSFFGVNFGSQDTPSNVFPATAFNGVSVLFNGVAAPLYFVFGSAGQINLAVPSELPESGTVSVQVKNAQGASVAFTLKMAPTDVGLFRIADPSNPKRNNGAVLFANTAWKAMPASMAAAIGFPNCDGASPAASCGQPAMIGDALQIYVTGLGTATPGGDPSGKALATGSLAPADGNPLYMTVQKPAVTVGGMPAQVIFSGIAAGNAALYQINVIVPEGVRPGDDVPVEVAMPGGTADTVTIAIRAK